MRRIFFAIAAASSLLLSLPAAAEDISAQAMAASIPIGASEQEVTTHFGAPTDRSLSQAGNEIWTYDIKKVHVEHRGGLLSDLGFSSGNEAGTESERIFRVWFDANGKVTAAKPLQQDD
ncbi:MAG: hypothetical protein Kilf2KO_10350 [Rhodospirillales bacterium]